MHSRAIASRVAALTLSLLLLGFATPSWAGQADVLTVSVQRAADGTYSFAVTVAHADAGWDHYADRWEVLGPNGEVLATRVLAHPHDEEQPFTRGLSGVMLPAGLDRVTVRAHDSQHGYGGAEVSVTLP